MLEDAAHAADDYYCSFVKWFVEFVLNMEGLQARLEAAAIVKKPGAPTQLRNEPTDPHTCTAGPGGGGVVCVRTGAIAAIIHHHRPHTRRGA